MMMSSSVGAVALMMGGDDDKKTGPTGPTGYPHSSYVRNVDKSFDAQTGQSHSDDSNELRVLDKSSVPISP
jgi:hypothetical protein